MPGSRRWRRPTRRRRCSPSTPCWRSPPFTSARRRTTRSPRWPSDSTCRSRRWPTPRPRTRASSRPTPRHSAASACRTWPRATSTRLIGDLTRFGSLNTLSTTVSRFLLSGMQAPRPVPPDEPLDQDALHGLYDVAGQQFPAPAGATYDIGFTKSTTASWFCFDPAVGELEAGPEGCADELLMTLTPDFLSKHAPSTVLDPQTVAGPTAMRLYDLDPPRYSLEQHIPWQPAADVALPGPRPQRAVGRRTVAVAVPGGAPAGGRRPDRPDGGDTSVRADRAQPGARGCHERAGPKQLQRFSWATAIPLRIERALDDTGAVVPGAYELTGADQASRDLLLKAWRNLDLSSSAPRPALPPAAAARRRRQQRRAAVRRDRPGGNLPAAHEPVDRDAQQPGVRRHGRPRRRRRLLRADPLDRRVPARGVGGEHHRHGRLPPLLRLDRRRPAGGTVRHRRQHHALGGPPARPPEPWPHPRARAVPVQQLRRRRREPGRERDDHLRPS